MLQTSQQSHGKLLRERRQLSKMIAPFLHCENCFNISWTTNQQSLRQQQPTCFNFNYQGNPSCPPQSYPPSNKGLIFGLIKGNRWLINPKNKAGYFLRGGFSLGFPITMKHRFDDNNSTQKKGRVRLPQLMEAVDGSKCPS